MKRKHYIIYAIILATLYILLPLGLFVLNRAYKLTAGEMMGLSFPMAVLLFFGTVGAGVLSEYIKD